MGYKQQILINVDNIRSKIFTFRETQVMIDRDIAELYKVDTRILNQAVKRNIKRFPIEFYFQLNAQEFENWKSQIVMSKEDKMGLRRPPYVFTEQGVAMLSAVLKSDIAINVSLQIMSAFVEMRKILISSNNLHNRLINLENKQIQNEHNFNIIFNEMEKTNLPTQGIYFDGQIFDAYVFVCNLIKSAKISITLIDNYIDESVLNILSKNENKAKLKLLTKSINPTLKLDLLKFKEQYTEIEVIIFSKAHDRFLIIDEMEIYHIGASIKDLGKKIFAFTKLDKISIEILKELK